MGRRGVSGGRRAHANGQKLKNESKKEKSLPAPPQLIRAILNEHASRPCDTHNAPIAAQPGSQERNTAAPGCAAIVARHVQFAARDAAGCVISAAQTRLYDPILPQQQYCSVEYYAYLPVHDISMLSNT